jgi:hypothetical protein
LASKGKREREREKEGERSPVRDEWMILPDDRARRGQEEGTGERDRERSVRER